MGLSTIKDSGRGRRAVLAYIATRPRQVDDHPGRHLREAVGVRACGGCVPGGRPQQRLHHPLLSSRRRRHPLGRRNPHTPDAAHAGDCPAGASDDGRRDGARDRAAERRQVQQRRLHAGGIAAAHRRGRRAGAGACVRVLPSQLRSGARLVRLPCDAHRRDVRRARPARPGDRRCSDP